MGIPTPLSQTEGKWKKVFKNIQGKICETKRRDIRRQGKRSWFHTTCVLASPALRTHSCCHPLKKAFPLHLLPNFQNWRLQTAIHQKKGTLSTPLWCRRSFVFFETQPCINSGFVADSSNVIYLLELHSIVVSCKTFYFKSNQPLNSQD